MGESQVMQEPLERLRLNATKCRELADTAITGDARDVLTGLAELYEQEAATIALSPAQRRRSPFKWSLD
jgi:hypothetical protein